VSTPSQATIDQFTSLDEETQRDLLEKMSPEAKGALLGALQVKTTVGNTSSTPAKFTPPSRPPGVLTRTAQAVGLPSSKAELDAMRETPTIMETLAGPVGTGINIAKGTADRAMSGEPEFQEAVQNIKEGGPVGANLGKAALAVGRGALSAIPGGEGVLNMGEDKFTGNKRGMIGDALGTVINALLLRGKGTPSESARVKKLGFATGSSSGTVSALEHVLPEIDETVKRGGIAPKDMTVGQFADAVQGSLTRLDQRFNTALQPIAAQQVAAHPIANALLAKAAELPPTAIAEKAALADAATQYQRPWTIRDLNAERMYRGSRNEAFYKKAEPGQMHAMRSDADTMIDKIVEEKSKEMVYSAMDRAYPGQDFTALKRRQSSLIDLKKQLTKHVEDLKDAEAMKQGQPAFVDPGLSASVYSGGVTPRVHMGSMIGRVLGRGPMEAADIATRSAYSDPSAVNAAARMAVLARPLLSIAPPDRRTKLKGIPPPPGQ
jgi:hypothetical protein